MSTLLEFQNFIKDSQNKLQINLSTLINKLRTFKSSKNLKTFLFTFAVFFLAIFLLIIKFNMLKSRNTYNPTTNTANRNGNSISTNYKKVELGSIKPLEKTIHQAAFLTDQGSHVFERAVTSNAEDQSSNVLSNYNSRLSSRLFDIGSHLIYFSNNEIILYNKTNKTIEKIKTEGDFFKYLKSADISVEKISEERSLINLLDYTDYRNHTYEFILPDLKLNFLSGLENNCGIYCGGPHIIKILSSDEILIDQPSGDACWGRDLISRYSFSQNKLSTVGSYGSGCREGPEFVGICGDSVISANYTYSDEAIYKDLLSTDIFSSEKKTLIDTNTIPSDVTKITQSDIDKPIYLETDKSLVYKTECDSWQLNKSELNSKDLSKINSLPQKFDVSNAKVQNYPQNIQLTNTPKPVSEITKAIPYTEAEDPDDDFYFYIYGEDPDGDKIVIFSSSSWDQFKGIKTNGRREDNYFFRKDKPLTLKDNLVEFSLSIRGGGGMSTKGLEVGQIDLKENKVNQIGN